MKRKPTSIQQIQFVFACLFFASLNFEMFSPFMENMSVSKMTAFLYFAVTLLSPPRLVFCTHQIGRLLMALFVMGGFMFISSVINSSHKVFDFTLFLNVLMFWVLLNHYRRDPRIFREGLIWFSLSAVVVGIFFLLGIGVTLDENNGRYMIFGDNQNTVGIKMAISILFLVNYTLHHSPNKPIHKPFLLVLSIPLFAVLFATASRTAALILVLGLLLFILARPALSSFHRFVWLIFGALFIIFGIQIINDQELLLVRLMQTVEEGNLSQRDLIWATYGKIILSNPIIGVGFSGVESVAMQVFGINYSPHNVFIEVALYSGILGLIPFLYFVVVMFRDAIRYAYNEKNLAPILLSIGTAGMLMAGQALGVKLFWVIAAFAISYQVSPYYMDAK